LTGDVARVPAWRVEEEFLALAGIADAAQQVFEAVHGAQATRDGGDSLVTDAPPVCD